MSFRVCMYVYVYVGGFVWCVCVIQKQKLTHDDNQMKGNLERVDFEREESNVKRGAPRRQYLRDW